jgi:EF hand
MLKRLVLVAALTIPFVAFAQSTATPSVPAPKTERAPKPAKGERFGALDANKDGFISRDEAKARPNLAKNFDQLDANRDGKLSKQELAAAKKERRVTKPAASTTQKG